MGQSSTSLSTSHYQFSSQLFEVVTANNKSSNVVFSPISIYLALLMATSGAKGTTLNEMLSGISIDQTPSTIDEWRHHIEPFVENFFSKLNTNILNVANNAFVESTINLDANYEKHVKKTFGVNVVKCDYAGNAEGERVKINEWVSSKTNQLIKDLIQPGLINVLTRLVLVNAVHFLGQWKNSFDKTETYPYSFYGVDGETKAPTMSKSETKEQYGAEGNYHWVTMPFSDTKYKMTIVAVKDHEHQATLESFVAQKLKSGIASFPTSEVKLTSFRFPKFEIEHGIELSEILKSAPFNIQTPFTSNADFTNLIKEDGIFLDKVIHRAVIKVDEEGAEASAATAMVFRTLSRDPNSISFVADSPFTFILSDESTQSILFVGKVNKL